MRLDKSTYDKLIKRNSLINASNSNATVSLDGNSSESMSAVADALAYYKLEVPTLSSSETSQTENWNILVEALQFLDAKIVAARKTATFWDAYNISSVAKTKDDFLKEYGKLATNSGLLIDSTGFSIGNDTYSRGDIVFKTNDNQQVHIQNSQTGYYKPTSIEATSTGSATCKINYTFVSGTTNDGSTEYVTLNNYNPNINDALLYDKFISLDGGKTSSNISFLSDAQQGQPIRPVYEVRTIKNGVIGEKIFNAVTFNDNSTTFSFTNNSSIQVVVLVK